MSTERMDSQGTDRMDTGTARMDAGTARMDAGTARIGGSPTGGGAIFAEGQTIVLNGNNCVIESLVSKGSGEAVVYKINIAGKPYALKHYKPNTPISNTAKNVLTKIRDNPKDKVVKIFDIGNYYGQDFEIMEYAEGGTLGDFIRKNGAIRDSSLKNVVRQINEGLQQLHGFYKTIYQDLKPENIFFRDAQKTSLVLADFGISSVMQGGSEEVEVVASNTDLYAAPELSRKGNNTTVEITPAVDYFALGITMYELWLGEQPFKDIKAITRERNIRDKNVTFPFNMPDDCKTLIQGLIDPLPKDRWRNEYVQKWLKGESLTRDSKKPDTVASINYKQLKFGNEIATNPEQIAALMEKYPEDGKYSLYNPKFVLESLENAGDATLAKEIEGIMKQYDKDHNAGLTAAIYTLDPERPFISRNGKICKSSEEIADAIMADSAHYMDDLRNNQNAGLYIYITVTGGSQGKEAADTFRTFFREYPPNRALTLVYLKLQSDDSIPLGSKRYLSIDEIAQEKDGAQIDLIKKAVKEKDSKLMVWIFDKYTDYFKSTDEFVKQSVADQFFLLGLIPFLSYKDLTGSNGEAALQDLIDNHAGRSDLFEVYVKQGLPIKGQILDSPIKKTPIDYVVCNYNDLKSMYGADTVLGLIRLLHKLGADVNEYSNDGRCPFINAVVKDNDLVELLRELGADEDFVSNGGKICKSSEDIADAIWDESGYYMDELKNPNTELYLYLIATGAAQGKEFADNFRKYFREYSAKRALSLVYVELQSDLGITIGSKRYQSLEELKQEKDNTQIDLVKKAVMEKDSLLLGWISVHDDYFRSFKSIEAFNFLTVPDQFFLLWLLPFLSYKELKGYSWENLAISDLCFLIDYVPGNLALFKAYVGQGLPLKGQILDVSSVKRTPIDYVVCKFNNLSKQHGADTVCNLIRLLCKLGADINEYSNNGTCPIINAFKAFLAGENDLIKLLLELGADVEQYRNYIEVHAKQELKEWEDQERRDAEQRDLLEKKRIRERDDRENRRKMAAKNAKTKIITTLVVIVASVGIFAGLSLYNSWFASVFNRHQSISDTVTAVKDKEFAGKQLTSVDIPDSVISIGNMAFTRNGLTNIDIPNSVVSIGDGAFSRNKLTSIVIPDSVTSIGDRAFANNQITRITIGANVTLGSGAFWFDFETAYNNNGMAAGTYMRHDDYSNDWDSWHGYYKFQCHNEIISVIDYNGVAGATEIPAKISGYPVSVIAEAAFRGKNLTSVIIPDSVTSIGVNAFRHNQLTSATIPNSVTSIEVNAFADNPVTSVRIGANVKLGDVGTDGVFGQNTGFNSAYAVNGNRAGTYTRPNINSTTWTRK